MKSDTIAIIYDTTTKTRTRYPIFSKKIRWSYVSYETCEVCPNGLKYVLFESYFIIFTPDEFVCDKFNSIQNTRPYKCYVYSTV